MVNARWVKPLDEEVILQLAAETRWIVTLERTSWQGDLVLLCLKSCRKLGFSRKLELSALDFRIASPNMEITLGFCRMQAWIPSKLQRR